MQETKKAQFHVELVKPSHYDDDGYPIQWARAFIPSNSLACMLSLVEDVRDRQGLGPDVDIVVNGYDEVHTKIPVRRIVKRIQASGGRGIVMLTGVQSNQFPRGADLAREFRAAGVPVAMGGFHVSGCVAMLPELTPELVELQELGVTLFVGEADGRMDTLLQDAWHGRMQPIYNYLSDLPGLQGAVAPFLPKEIAKRYMLYTSFDAGRGCPFECSFCTIINVQGRKSRFRSADDVERIVRAYWAEGVNRFFITDDNFARNKNWEAIVDRLIELREKEKIEFKFIIQVDTVCHKIPNFIDKVAKAGCNKVYVGMESIHPENLKSANKGQNKISEYKKMFLAWREHRVLTYAGYILGFPFDTPESIERDIKVIQRELPIDIMEFMVLTPLPGSMDHKVLAEKGVWMDPDLNKYDLEHVTTRHHPLMSADELQSIYDRVWHLFYTPEHIETLVRRGEACGSGARRVAAMIWQYYGAYCIEDLHPLQCGILRRKQRRARRPDFPRESPLVFYPRYAANLAVKCWKIFWMWRDLRNLRNLVRSDPNAKSYTDRALTITEDDELTLTPVAPPQAEPAVAARDVTAGTTA